MKNVCENLREKNARKYNMATILKCKMCGGDLENIGAQVATCLYCGSKQILPKSSSEKKANLYDRANHYRSINEFDKAAAVYEQALAEDTADAEIYWDLVLCTYGVEYVEDPLTKKRIPTVNRTQFQSIFDDRNYKSAIANASKEQKEILEADAVVIDKIQKEILDISNKEQPYDIFICYKETDDAGRRTPDSVMAQDLYKELSNEGYKVFFSRITLEDKLGSAYEPYIFAALNSAKVMIVVGTRPEYFNAVWVKNEWSRFLGLIKAGKKKTLIPAYKDMDPYDLPEEFSHLQAQDMGKLGFIQDVIRGIGKILGTVNVTNVPVSNSIDVDAYKTRIEVFLENGDFSSAKEYCDKVLDVQPKDAETYILKLCAELCVKKRTDLGSLSVSFGDNPSFQNAIKFSDSTERKELESYLELSKEKEKAKRKKSLKIVKVVASAAAVVCVIAGVTTLIIRNQKLNASMVRAEKLANDGKYIDAYSELYNLAAARSKNAMLVDFILAGCDIENGKYDDAKTKMEQLADYKDSENYLVKVRYKMLSAKLNDVDIAYAKQELQDLKDKGIIDIYGLEDRISSKEYKEQFIIRYSAKQYSSCASHLERWKEKYPNDARKFIEENQETWYQTARVLVNYDDFMVEDASELMALCDKSYKDVEMYNELFEAYDQCNAQRAQGNQENCDLGVMWKYIDKAPMTKKMIWVLYRSWFGNRMWKTSDGTKYFSIDKDGYSSYNLPGFDAPDTYFDIDYNGIYYIYDKDDNALNPTTRRDMYRFEIVNLAQVNVYCYKNSSRYTLYREAK